MSEEQPIVTSEEEPPEVSEQRDEPSREENKEEVKKTLLELKNESAPAAGNKKSVARVFLLIAEILFFPITLGVMGVRKIFKRFKVGITAKTTVVFTVVFGLMLIGYASFTLASIYNAVKSGDADSDGFMSRLIITSAALVALFIVIGSVLGGLSSQYMLSPVRRISERVREITDENISSARLDPVDSQDEFMVLTEQINAMLDSLRGALERQENFVSDASHELKTPLAVIAGYANLLRRWGKDDPKILDEAVEAISRESENMKRIVEQLLWLAKLGDFTLNNSIFNLYEAVDDIVEGYRTVKIKHKINLSGDASVTLNTDKNLITEAVRTLVDNAIKYTPEANGVIDILIKRFDDRVELSVSDNGIGISAPDAEHIFERFYRCDKVRGRESGSSGLGLTICKSIVEMMGGKIEVSSVLGEGSKFTITLY